MSVASRDVCLITNGTPQDHLLIGIYPACQRTGPLVIRGLLKIENAVKFLFDSTAIKPQKAFRSTLLDRWLT